MMLRKTKHIHFVGIGGAGMSGIAEVLINLNYKVSGSDISENVATMHLRGIGADIYIGHDSKNIIGADVVVVSSAIKEDNCEVLQAKDLLIPVIPRAEMLSELMRLKYGVAVAGSHGKTTTTSMISKVLTDNGLDPTIVIGGRLGSKKSGAKLGEGDLLIAEADESDGSFLRLTPTVAVVTSIDREHMDYYKGIPRLKETFLQFVNKIPFYGLGVLCLDDENIQDILPDINKRYQTYGLQNQADFTAKDIVCLGMQTSFRVYYGSESLGSMSMNLPGIHNVLNALATIVVAREFDIPFEKIADSLGTFKNVERRFQIKYDTTHLIVVDDYGHHPTEIKATLNACRQVWPDRRLIVVFQPHRYSRTKLLMKEFCRSFYDADIVIITKIYGAGENTIEGISGMELVEGTKRHGHRHVIYGEDSKDIISALKEILREGDVVLTLGAGSIWHISNELIKGKI